MRLFAGGRRTARPQLCRLRACFLGHASIRALCCTVFNTIAPRCSATLQRHTLQRHTLQRHTLQRHILQRHTLQRHILQRHAAAPHCSATHCSATLQRHTLQRHTLQRHTLQRHTAVGKASGSSAGPALASLQSRGPCSHVVRARVPLPRYGGRKQKGASAALRTKLIVEIWICIRAPAEQPLQEKVCISHSGMD
eukprot:352427-Chlamydomonas_euryale.AAC.10